MREQKLLITGAFVISWATWNFRPLLNILSSAPFSEKLAFLDTFYLTTWEHLSFGFLYPLFSAIAFILIYPFPARWTYHYWHWQQNKTKEIRQRIEDETPVTQAEARHLRKVSSDVQRQLQGQLTDQTTANNELANRLRLIDEERVALLGQKEQIGQDRDDLLKNRDMLEYEKNHLAAEHEEMKETLKQQHSQVVPIAGEPQFEKTDKPIFEKLPINVVSELRRKGVEDEGLKLFVDLIRAGGEVKMSDYLIPYSQMQRIEVNSTARSLVNTPYVAFIRNGGCLALTAKGQDLAVELQLTKLLS